jgi:hypothetical protein
LGLENKVEELDHSDKDKETTKRTNGTYKNSGTSL